MSTSSIFTVAGTGPVDLDAIAAQLRQQIDQLPPDEPKLAAQKLACQSGVEEYLVVVRTNEEPHVHPEGDLVIATLEGGGYVQLDGSTADAPAGSVVVVPKNVCHAYFNLSPTDSVLFATFSPINSKADCPTLTSATSGY